MPSLNHGSIQANLIAELTIRYKARFRIISELSLDAGVRPMVPDLCLYPKRPLDLKNDVTTMTEPPLCAVEILSPSQSLEELVHKAADYFRLGVQSCWIVLPPVGNVYVFSDVDHYQIFRADETLRDEKIGIDLPLGEVFV